MTILVVAEHVDTSLRHVTLHTMAAAAIISMFSSKDVHMLVVGAGTQAVGEAASIAGVSTVLYADTGQFVRPLSERILATLLEVANDYTHILFPATMDGSDIASYLAMRLGGKLFSCITAVNSADEFVLPIDASNAMATVRSSDPVTVVTVDPAAFDPASATGGSASIVRIDIAPAAEPVNEVF